jgi:transposase
MQIYDEKFKEEIARLHIEEGRSINSLYSEYSVSKASINKWCKVFKEKLVQTPKGKQDYDVMKENANLRRQLAEVEKENEFLKKAATFFAKELG